MFIENSVFQIFNRKMTASPMSIYAIFHCLIFREFEFLNSFKVVKSDFHLGVEMFDLFELCLKNFRIVREFFANMFKFSFLKRRIRILPKKFIPQSINTPFTRGISRPLNLNKLFQHGVNMTFLSCS